MVLNNMIRVLLFILIVIVEFFCIVESRNNEHFNDICGVNNGKRFYLEFGDSGPLLAKYENHFLVRNYNNVNNKNYYRNVKNITKEQQISRCSIEFITCPSCVVQIKFRYLNISRTCGKSSVFDSCGCDYVLIYEPPFEDVSGEQFCGRFIQNNMSEVRYNSQTRSVAISFVFSSDYGHAFTLDYSAERNKINLTGSPKIGNMNNASQVISSPFFPNWYPPDLSVEYLINCWSTEPCRISLVFTDFLVADSSILEFFDWNGQRMYVISGNIFRPPVIVSSGPSLVIRFYANGASDFGFKATYSFVLGNLDDSVFKPNIGCGGHVNNLGGGITMMNMISEGTKFFDCIWIVKPPGTYLHRKTHLYVKVVTFADFAGTTELVIRQGLTSNEPSVEVFRYPFSHFGSLSKKQEHVVPVAQGFYISLKGLFRKESRLAIVYAAFNYKDCYSGSDFLCHNLRCIPVILNCDGFDHCGDSSDESPSCSQDPTDHRQFSKIPNFLFPKMDSYSDLTVASLVFLMCTFGIIGIIFAVALLLYRVNMKARHQRQIQDHLETIHAILEEGVGSVEEEIIIPDEPPDYEPPPDYSDVLKLQKYLESVASQKRKKRCPCCQAKSAPQNRLRTTSNESPKSIESTNILVQNGTTSNNMEQSITSSSVIPEDSITDIESSVMECPSCQSDQSNVSQNPIEGSIIGQPTLTIEEVPSNLTRPSTSRSCQTTPVRAPRTIPESPPPAYERVDRKPFQQEPDSLENSSENRVEVSNDRDLRFNEVMAAPTPTAVSCATPSNDQETHPEQIIFYKSTDNVPVTCFTNISPTRVFKDFSVSLQKSIKNCKPTMFIKKFLSRSEENIVKCYSDSELTYTASASGSVGQDRCFWNQMDKRSMFKKSYSTDDIFTF